MAAYTSQNVHIFDGGLATELERKGFDLDHPLWSSKILLSNPEAIEEVHLEFLKAGADYISTCSYQLSYAGGIKIGLDEEEITRLLYRSAQLAKSARNEFIKINKDPKRLKPMIGASIGPYGAYLADGSEYNGHYGISDNELYGFHILRWNVLSDTDIDLMACETIPSYQEAKVLLKILHETPKRNAFISFSCKNGIHISDGTPIQECAALLQDQNQISAIGINCTPPKYISSLIQQIKKVSPELTILVYPNSGESYDPVTKTWLGECDPNEFSEMAVEWYELGARWIGGCCRTRPAHIASLREEIIKAKC